MYEDKSLPLYTPSSLFNISRLRKITKYKLMPIVIFQTQDWLFLSLSSGNRTNKIVATNSTLFIAEGEGKGILNINFV